MGAALGHLLSTQHMQRRRFICSSVRHQTSSRRHFGLQAFFMKHGVVTYLLYCTVSELWRIIGPIFGGASLTDSLAVNLYFRDGEIWPSHSTVWVMVQKVLRFLETFRRDSWVWRTDRRTDGHSPIAYAAFRYVVLVTRPERFKIACWAFVTSHIHSAQPVSGCCAGTCLCAKPPPPRAHLSMQWTNKYVAAIYRRLIADLKRGDIG